MQTSAILLLVWAAQSAPAADWPPEPDFITPVDYSAWFEQRVRRGEPQSQNAAAFYREILGEPSSKTESIEEIEKWRFGGGPRWNEAASEPRPWLVTERADWRAAQEARKPFIERYKREAAKAYIEFRSADYGASPPLLFPQSHVETSWQWRLRSWASCVSDHAWMAENGRPDVREFSALIAANLGLARQAERSGRSIVSLTGGSVRRVVYQDVLELLDRGLLTAAERRRLFAAVRSADTNPPSVSEMAPPALAEWYQSLQESAWPEARWWPPDTGRAVPVVDGAMRARLLAARDELRGLYQGIARLAPTEWTPELAGQISQVARSAKRPNSEIDILDYGRMATDSVRLHFPLLVNRRATWLVCELFEFHDLSGRFPSDLDELNGVEADLKTDPLGGKPFVYVRTSDSFRLYSAGLNCRNDGGVHDQSWGKKNPDSDYVIWPVERKE